MFLSRVGVFTNHFFCGPLYILETRDIVCFVAIFIVLIVAVLNSLRKEADKIMTGLPIVIIVIIIIIVITIVVIITVITIISIISMIILFTSPPPLRFYCTHHHLRRSHQSRIFSH